MLMQWFGEQLRGNVHFELRRLWLLELRCPLRSSTTSCKRSSGYLLYIRYASVYISSPDSILCYVVHLDPVAALPPPSDYYERVKTAHTVGGFGSLGYRAPWQPAESSKLLLRTHTTACSARLLYQLANRKGGFKPVKMFSIDRVFRNEATDATHLAEFHQVEGVVADYGLTLADLIGMLKPVWTPYDLLSNDAFRLHADVLQENGPGKPAFQACLQSLHRGEFAIIFSCGLLSMNTLCKPSLEIFAFHPQLKKWVEIGNSGMFRPEMLAPMGLPPGVRVHGWGLSLERPTMIRYM